MGVIRQSETAFTFAVMDRQAASKRESFDKFIRLFNLIVSRTPVDSGELRANIEARYGLSQTRQYKFGRQNEVLPPPVPAIVFNPKNPEPMVIGLATPYALQIEFGSWSNKAPSGMVGISVQEVYGVR